MSIMKLQTFQSVLGWEAQHINKLVAVLRKHPLFSEIAWSNESKEFHQKLFEKLSVPGCLTNFEKMVESIEFDPNNRKRKNLSHNIERYNIQTRWVFRTMEFIKKEEDLPNPELAFEHILKFVVSGNQEAVLQVTIEALKNTPGGNQFIEFHEWLSKIINDEVDDKSAFAKKEVFEAIFQTASRPEIQKAFRDAYETDTDIRDMLKDGLTLLAKITVNSLISDPASFYSIVSDLALGATALNCQLSNQNLCAQIRLIYAVLGLGSPDEADKKLVELTASSNLPTLHVSIQDGLKHICKTIQSMAEAVAEEQRYRKPLGEAVQRGAYDEISALAEKAQAAKRSLAEIHSLQFMPYGELATMKMLLNQAQETNTSASKFISELLQSFSSMDAIEIATAYTNYPADLLPATKKTTTTSCSALEIERVESESLPEDEQPLADGVTFESTENAAHSGTVIRQAIESAFVSPTMPNTSVLRVSRPNTVFLEKMHSSSDATSAKSITPPIGIEKEPSLPVIRKVNIAPALQEPALTAVVDGRIASWTDVVSEQYQPITETVSPAVIPAEKVVSKPEATPLDAADEMKEALNLSHQNGTFSLEGCFAACVDERYDVAFWLSWLANRSKMTGWNHNVFSTFVFGNRIRPDGFIGGEMITCLSALHSDDFNDAPYNNLLLAGGLLAPALFCADKHAVLYALRDFTVTGLPKLDDLIAKVFELGMNKDIHLTPSDVKRAGESTDHSKTLAALAEESTNELHKAQVVKMTFWPGESLLHAIYRKGMALNTLHQVVTHNDVSRLSDVRELLNTISPEQLTDSYELAPGLDPSKCPPMIGPARVRFLRYINTSLSIARRWTEMHDSAVGTVNTFRQREIEYLRAYVKKSSGLAISEIKSNLGRVSSSMDAALHAVSFAVSRITKVLAGDQLPKDHDIYTMLAPHPGIVLDDDFTPVSGADDGLVDMLQMALPEDPVAAFAASLRRGEFVRAKFLLDQYKLDDHCQDDFKTAIEKNFTKLEAEVDDLETRVEDAYLLGELTEFLSHNNGACDMQDQHATRSEMLGKLISARSSLQTMRLAEEPRLLDVMAKIKEVAEFTEKIKQASHTKMRERSDRIAREFPQNAEGQEDCEYFREHFNRCMSVGDQVAASEVVHQAEQAIRTNARLALMPINGCTVLQAFEAVEPVIQREIEGKKMRLDGVGASIRAGKEAYGLSFEHLIESLRESAAKVIESLQRMKDSTTSDPTLNVVQLITSTLGFDLTQNSAKVRTRGNDYRVVDFELRFVPNCPIPAFGTNLNKRLTILLLLRRFWGSTPEPPKILSSAAAH